MKELSDAMVKTMFSQPLYWIIVILGICAYIIIKIRERKIAKESYKCPKCGGLLMKRNGKYGEFIGCSNFPKCRFIIKK